MKVLFAILEAYTRLVAHDVFMSRNDLAGLHEQIRRFPKRATDSSTAATQLLSHALDLACAFYPKRALCLQRSAVLVKMLRRRGSAAHMIIGAQKLPFKAHAWVEVDGEIINDRLASREKFLILEVC
jgi:Transglutaminase-like superfamily